MTTTTLAPTDAEIESLLQACGAQWEGSFWMIEDADLHPAVRTVLAKWGAPVPASGDVRSAAQALVDRWDTPKWKDAEHTGAFIQRLREALAAPPAQEVRVPLSDAEALAIVRSVPALFTAEDEWLYCIREVEHHHGITAAQKETP